MPTFIQQPIDVQWIVQLASGTSYTGWFPALAAAVALSAGNSNAPVQIGLIAQTATAPTASTLANVQLDTAPSTPQYIVQLQSGTTYYPLATALTQAYATSTSNSNAPVNIARVIEVVTSP